ncbi:MAG TPA: right-handed parallel beta-helix repeat-containing protein, partial [Bacteroidia bacterium]|nr:right-handed parallel beta-helix repeat-containing protein [Bacteroidia bacterium]
MKSNKTLSVVASCFLILLFFSGKSQAGILKIGKNFSIKSIKEGVVKAQPFDTLYIHSGLYKEQNILIEKSLSLIGVENPVLDGENNFEVLTINANSVLVSGLTIKNSGYSSMKDLAGIKVMNSRQFLIKNNTLINSYFAIHIANCDNFRIENNTIRGTPGTDEQSTGNAIHLWKCLYASIKNNDISGHRDGIYFEFVGNSYIEQNNSYNNLRYGLHFMFSNKDSYIDNKFTDNGA